MHLHGLQIASTMFKDFSFFLFQFPSVSKPQSLEKRYHGILSSVMIDFMNVSKHQHQCTKTWCQKMA